MPKRICAALMLALAVLATAGCAGTDRFQAQADVVRAYGWVRQQRTGRSASARSLIAGYGPESGFPDALGDVLQRFLDLVDQDQAQVAGLQARQRRVDGQELAVDLIDLLGAGGVDQAWRSSATTSPSARPRWHWSW